METADWRILVVEKPHHGRSGVTPVLQEAGYQVTSVPTPEKALLAWDRVEPHLTLLDVDLEGEEGEALLERLRQETDLGFVPCVLVADDTVREKRLPVLELGAEDILRVPFAANELLVKVRSHLDRVRLRMELASCDADLMRVNRELAHLLDMKNRFLSLVTHDIRTPISTMKLVGEVLHGLPDTTERQKDVLGILLRSIDTIERKLEDLLLITRIDVAEQPLRTAPVDVDQLVQAGVAALFARAINQGVELDLALGEVPEIRGDAAQLNQLVQNLIVNSLERLREGEHVLISTQATAEGVAIRVTDDARPLPPDEAQSILRGLKRKEPTSQTRVSLYAAFEIVRRHGGELLIGSGPEGGALFEARLPAAPPVRGAEAEETTA